MENLENVENSFERAFRDENNAERHLYNFFCRLNTLIFIFIY